ncbi:AAA family ATPase [Candidatus Saccharibacteria bacterium]|nr:AAA family ATPase [Candidatus Saccharibacteria bacterium]
MKSIQLSTPHLLVAVGLPGSGKTTFCQRFSDTFRAPFINASSFGHDSKTNVDLSLAVLSEIMKTQQTILYEGETDLRRERQELAKFGREHGYEVLFIWVQTDESMANARATRRSKSNPFPLSSEEFRQRSAKFSPLHPTEKSLVISGMHTHASQAKVVLKRLTENTARVSTNLRPAERPASAPSRRSVIIR